MPFRDLPEPNYISQYSILADIGCQFSTVPTYYVTHKGKCIAACLSPESAEAVANLCDYVDLEHR